MLINYIKKHFIISLILSAVLTTGLILFDAYSNSGYFKSVGEYVLAFFGAFGGCAVYHIIAVLFFPHLVMDEEEDIEIKGEIDREHYIEAYFYEGFRGGVSKVIRVTGDSRKPDEMQRDFNFMDENENYIFKDWFLTAENFVDGRVIVMDKNFRFNIGTVDGKLLCGDGYWGMSSEVSDGKVKVGDGEGHVNFVRIEDGSLVWKTWKLESIHD